jgi:hypothetical protein
MCVRPEHLFLGTVADNNRDMMNKGRARWVIGESCPTSKLTAEKVRAIRQMRAEGYKLREVAAAFDMSIAAIWKAAHGSTWTHVT